MQSFPFSEKYLSQIPALQLLIGLGYRYLSPEQARSGRGEPLSNILLEDILQGQLGKINRICHNGSEYPFNKANIRSAVQKLKNVQDDSSQKTNEAIYDLLTLGAAFKETIDGNSKSFTLNYIDWKNSDQNVFHVTAEFPIERSRGTETVRPDIVLFVNGIPLVVIECKAPDTEVEQAVSQNIRNQDDEYIPRFFTYMQIVLAVNKNEAKYATAGTSATLWSVWNELEDPDNSVADSVSKILSSEDKDHLFSGEFGYARSHFDALENEGGRSVTEQDKCLYSLCRPERLLEIIYGFIVYDSGVKKIARYQQFFLVRSAVKRIKQTDNSGRRRGGIVWHTQGSGKSITMVMLARALISAKELTIPRLILVTDRKNLDKQLGNTFKACGLGSNRATSGRDLVERIRNKEPIITTLINKFDRAISSGNYVDDSADIVVLVDESHRTNFGSLAAQMRKMLPNACYIGFTGTPLLKTEKNSFAKFGDLIEPHYSVRQALEDKAVVPLLYEGRHVEMEQNREAIDLWFDRHTEGLSDRQKDDLKRKYARARELSKADAVVFMCAFDINKHFQFHWRETGFKAQLVAPNKVTALKYHKGLKEMGKISSEVVVSPPDMREGYEEVGEQASGEVHRFWNKMMERYGSEDEYNKQIIDQFKEGEEPEILIVVDKLITGFDAPRNTVLYLCRKLREHTLLQAIARVNRLYEGKEFGYIIDYANVLGELDQALETYDALAGFDKDDLADSLRSLNEEAAKLPQLHSDLWDIFKEIKHSRDEEHYERLLADEALRDNFYECLRKYSKILAIALSSEQFITQTGQGLLNRYKNDCKRFQKLKKAVKIRYADAVDYRDYEPRIKKLLNTHIQANEVTQMNEPVNIFDNNTFNKIKEEHGDYVNKTRTARADTIAHATKRVIAENMDQDPAFYEKFSKLIQDAIDDFKRERISDLEYLQKVCDIRDQVVNKQRDDVPADIRDNDDACAYFGAIRSCLSGVNMNESKIDDLSVRAALAVQEALKKHWKVDFWNDSAARNDVANDIDDFLFDELGDKHDIGLSDEQKDEFTRQTMKIAKSRHPS